MNRAAVGRHNTQQHRATQSNTTATASVDACQAEAMRDRLDHHLFRKITPCTSETTFSHVDLANYLKAILLGWAVLTPGEPVEELPDAPSQYPRVAAREPEELAPEALGAFLVQQGVEQEVLSGLDLVDKLNGHCETVAVSCATRVIAALRDGSSLEQALCTAFDKMVKALKSANIQKQVALLFEPEARMMKSAERLWGVGGRAMWGPLRERASWPGRLAHVSHRWGDRAAADAAAADR